MIARVGDSPRSLSLDSGRRFGSESQQVRSARLAVIAEALAQPQALPDDQKKRQATTATAARESQIEPWSTPSSDRPNACHRPRRIERAADDESAAND